jgi:hypothetical protein
VLSVLTTNQKGLVAEAAVIKACAQLGVPISRPLADEPYDLILDLRSVLLRVQCKWAPGDDDVIHVRCRRCRRGPDGLIHGRYEPHEIDAVAAYSPVTDHCYLLPHDLSVSRAGVELRLRPPKNNQSMGIRWASEYQIAARLEALRGP